MGKLFTANRVAAIATWLAGLGGLIAAFQGVFPAGWQNATLAAASLLTKAVVGLTFLVGSQKSEALQARTAAVIPSRDATLVGLAANPDVAVGLSPAEVEQARAIEAAVDPLASYAPDPNFNPVSALAPQREDEAARSPSNPPLEVQP